MLNAIAKPFGILLLWLYNFVDNYGIAIFLFALVVKLILLPFQIKSSKSMMRMNALNEQVKELQKRHEGNPRKLQEETNKLYKEEHVSPMSGCLWTLIPFPILIALYQAIRFPMTVMMRVPAALLEEGGALLNKLNEVGFNTYVTNAGLSERTLSGYKELVQSQFISNNWAQFEGISEELVHINYKFLGLNLGDMPQWNFFAKCDWSDTSSWLPALGLFLIPIISAALSWLQMKLSQNSSTSSASANNPQAAASMKSMNLMMPLVSLYIGFIMPAALGVYWIFTSILATIQQIFLNKILGKQLEAEKAEREERMRIKQAEYERRRQETERLKAEGKTQENTNTSKKKQQARQKAELDELKAAAIREERAAKRAKLGIVDEEKPASQVGNRRYARGRAYVADRFTNPENAAAATAAALAANEVAEAEAAETVAATEVTEATETVQTEAVEVETFDTVETEDEESEADDIDEVDEAEDEESEDVDASDEEE